MTVFSFQLIRWRHWPFQKFVLVPVPKLTYLQSCRISFYAQFLIIPVLCSSSVTVHGQFLAIPSWRSRRTLPMDRQLLNIPAFLDVLCSFAYSLSFSVHVSTVPNNTCNLSFSTHVPTDPNYSRNSCRSLLIYLQFLIIPATSRSLLMYQEILIIPAVPVVLCSFIYNS
jgi:hypothetical protein